MADYEQVLCVKNEVFVFKIPPRPSNRGYRAADWKLDIPDWTGRLRVVALGNSLSIKLEDKNSGELFAKCPVETYPGPAVEAVTDSSRYFVLRIMDESGRSASIGIGFQDRGDSFDLNVALQDHFKYLKKEKEAANSSAAFDSGPKLDLGFKEGQTIKINIGGARKADAKARPKPQGGGVGFLPPPPGAKIAPPPGGAAKPFAAPPAPQPAAVQPQATPQMGSADLLLDFGASPPSTQSQQQKQQQALAPPAQNDPWGDFTSASNSSSTNNGNWVQFS